MILQRVDVTETLPTPHTLELPLSRVSDLVLNKVLSLFERLVAVVTLIRLLTGVHSAMSVHIGRVFEAFVTVRTLHWLLPGWVTPVLHKV